MVILHYCITETHHRNSQIITSVSLYVKLTYFTTKEGGGGGDKAQGGLNGTGRVN